MIARGQTARGHPLRRSGRLLAVALLCVVALSTGVAAKELRIALAVEPTTIDPHVQASPANLAFASHIFDRLVHTDDKQQVTAGLAVWWSAIDPTTWEFKLRRDVTWHDGTAFTANDVIASMRRAAALGQTPTGLGHVLKGKTFAKVDDYTVRVTTSAPYPLMANDLAGVPIIAAKYAEAPTGDFNGGTAAIGTGPYKFAAFLPGDRIELTANPTYWGTKPEWSRVIIRAQRSGPSRVAALLAGDADVIEDVPTSDIARMRNDGRAALAQCISYRVIFLQLDQWREQTPFANARDGGAVKNPFKNPRVRRAVALAIDRAGIVSRVMDGNALPAAQLLPYGFFGVSEAARVLPHDPEGARKLLAEAGYPGGFKVTLHGPSGRYPNDVRILEAVAQQLTRVGIEATIETMPPATFFARASTGADGQPEFSVMLTGWSAVTGENSSPLKALLASTSAATGLGVFNRGRYANRSFDEALDAALTSVDIDQVRANLAKATDIALADAAIVPILHPLNTWAVRKGLTFAPRADEATTAMSVSSAP